MFLDILVIVAKHPSTWQLSCFGQPIQTHLNFLAGGFHAPFAGIFKSMCSGPPNNALLPRRGPIHKLWLFISFLLSLLWVIAR